MVDKSFRWMPEMASNFALDVDLIYGFLVLVTVFFTALICVLVMGFAIYYRRGAKVDRGVRFHSNFMEVVWASGPFVLSMAMFLWGALVFFDMKTPPENTLDIQVVGKQWMWKIQHPEGRTEINALHVPLGQPVRLRMISEDVIHSFFIPAFRVKQDVLPAFFSQLWFTPTKVGTYHLFCAEYCGTEHSQMIGQVVVMHPQDYARWLADAKNDPPSVVGERLYERFRCGACHKADGSGNGPALAAIFGKMRPLKGGGAQAANEQYLRDAIMNPHKQILAGYQSVMPSFQGQLSESDALAITSYLKSLSVEPATPPAPKDEAKPATTPPGGNE
ncbi:cytochrome c oxidase subunit II [Planctomicrobium piriforme]|uniref:cytochrome-c oxidase n=1 Tax=Planctomicrobium piriforme TaxID=1576369 RepID=A0A1I3JFL1_9PLAN|nr:cytochrome c oxidase subunit II [Planctomicrobium piriforme]SFI58999.1 cytochrome c oxidase subunit 2 [Planctomicrobium piriforme]